MYGRTRVAGREGMRPRTFRVGGRTHGRRLLLPVPERHDRRGVYVTLPLAVPPRLFVIFDIFFVNVVHVRVEFIFIEITGITMEVKEVAEGFISLPYVGHKWFLHRHMYRVVMEAEDVFFGWV